MKNNITTGKSAQGANSQNAVATTLKVVKDENPSVNPQTSQDKKPEPEPTPEPKAKKDTSAIILKAQKMNQVIDGLRNLDEAFKDLDSINPSNSPKLRDTLKISDGRGGEFETSNNFLIEETISFLKLKVEGRTAQLESELQLLEAA